MSFLPKLKIAILWTNWAGYMDACAKELQSLTQCELDIICYGPTALHLDSRRSPVYQFERSSFFKYSCSVYKPEDLEALAINNRYDLVLICGWHVASFRRFASSVRGKSIRVLCMDNQWVGSIRQWMGVLGFHIYLRFLFEYAFVPGFRQGTFARKLGFSTRNTIDGHLSCDIKIFEELSLQLPEQKNIIFIGRLISEKGVDILAQAWRIFCDSAEHADWRLIVCGAGPLAELLSGLPQTEFMGFVQPEDLPAIMGRSCAFVLPSRKEPWGIVVHEAAAAGLPLIVSERCGAADYFCRPNFNGYCIAGNDVSQLLHALEKMANLTSAGRSEMGRRSRFLASQRSPKTWAASVTRALKS